MSIDDEDDDDIEAMVAREVGQLRVARDDKSAPRRFDSRLTGTECCAPACA